MTRDLALSNPLLDFDSILFVKRAPTMFPHLSDQYYGWWSRPGGGLFLLEGLSSSQPTVRCLTKGWPSGNFLRPDLSFDGRRVLFAFSQYDSAIADERNKRNKDNVPSQVFYHLFEMDLVTGQTRQLTSGKYDDFDGHYLPSGDILFLSMRRVDSCSVQRQIHSAPLRRRCPIAMYAVVATTTVRCRCSPCTA